MQYRSLTRQTPPNVEPVSLAEAKAHLRVDSDTSDAEIAAMISAAREWVETYLDRTLVTTQWAMRLDKFPPDSLDDIELPRPPVATEGTATAVSITYTLEAGGTAALATNQFRVDRHSTPGAVKTLYAGTWPSHMDDDNSITITWYAGYGASGSSVPAAIKHAMLMLIGFWHENRSAVLVGSISKGLEYAVESLLSSHRWGSYK